MADSILQSRDGDVVTITLNVPDNSNRMTDEMAVDLTNRINTAGKDAKLIVFRAAGKDFCTGRATMGQKPSGPPKEAYDMRDIFDTVFNLYAAFRDSPAPVLGVVQGPAYGLGIALTGLCDITVASDTATFQVPEMQHNIMPTMVMSALIDRISRKALMYLTYSTDIIDAQTALVFGLADKVVPAADLDSAVEEMVKQIASEPMVAVRGTKEFVANAHGRDMANAVAYARSIHAMVNASSKIRE